MADASEYEVRCPRCDVSFPTDTKTCMHCGGATGPSVGPRGRIRVRDQARPAAPADATDSRRFELLQTARAEPIDVLSDEEEASPGRSGILRGAATLVWIVLAIGISIARGCSDGD